MRLIGEQPIRERLVAGQGFLLLGSHLESFEILRALAIEQEHFRLRVLMKRESSLLSVPISSRGQLEYRAPDRIFMSSDKGDQFEISGDTVRVLKKGRLVQEVAASDHRSLQSLVSALKAVFSGNLEPLRQDYLLNLHGGERDWSLELEPGAASPTSRVTVTRIGVFGAGAAIRRIELQESDGDMRRLQLRVLDRKPQSSP